MSRPKRYPVQVSKEVKDSIVLLCKQKNMPQGLLLGYALDQLIKYNMLEPTWIEDLLKVRFSELVKEHDFQFRKEVELVKLKSVTRIRESMIKMRLSKMEDDQAIAYIDQVLGDPERAGDVIDRITSQQVFVVNGQNKMLEPNPDGLPRIVGIPPSQIVRCPKGFHTALDDCRSCSDRLSCETRQGLIIEWIAVHGTKKEQEQFLITGNFDVSRRES